MTEGGRSVGSFRDPSGFIFFRDGRCLRQVNRSYRGHYETLMGSGLYDRLAGAGLLVPHEDVGDEAPDPSSAFAVIRPEPIPLVSYPYEWGFGQLRDAALLTLAVQRHALEFGMTLKDASAYNVQFRGSRAVSIDTLSFDAYREGEPWVAYRQFCQHFLAPLALMAMVDVRLNQLFRTNIDGVPLDLAASLLPWRSKFRPSLLAHVHLHAGSQARHADTAGRVEAGAGAKSAAPPGRFGKAALLGLLDSLEAGVSGLRWAPRGTEWADYYECNTYTEASTDRKARFVSEALDRVDPGSVWDLGANTGRFSRLASSRGVPTAAFDVDPACVEANYAEARRVDDAYILPLRMDLFNPSPGLGWAGRERMSLDDRGPADLALALALVHHLAVGGGLPVAMIAAYLARLARNLVVEHVPADDPQARRLRARRSAWHDDLGREEFERAFGERFAIARREPVGDGGRTLYLMNRREP